MSYTSSSLQRLNIEDLNHGGHYGHWHVGDPLQNPTMHVEDFPNLLKIFQTSNDQEFQENFIQDRILPAYGNTHTLSTATARQSTFFSSLTGIVARPRLFEDADFASQLLIQFCHILPQSKNQRIKFSVELSRGNEARQIVKHYLNDPRQRLMSFCHLKKMVSFELI